MIFLFPLISFFLCHLLHAIMRYRINKTEVNLRKPLLKVCVGVAAATTSLFAFKEALSEYEIAWRILYVGTISLIWNVAYVFLLEKMSFLMPTKTSAAPI